MSHTPGPWKVDEDGFVWGCCPGPAFMKEAHFLIAEVRGWGYLQYRAGGERIQAANARLIAAAPELLEVIREAVDSAEREMAKGRKASPGLATWLEKARAALAKARADEGKENA